MTLFKHNLGNDILLSSQYASLLFKSNEALETVIFELAKKDFGKVSAICKRIIKDEGKGKSIEKNIERLSQSKIHPQLKSFMAALLGGSMSHQQLSEISKDIISGKKRFIEGLMKKTDTATDWFLYLPFVPIILIMKDMIVSIFSNLPADMVIFHYGEQFNAFFLNSIILVIAAFSLTFIIFIMRYKKEKGVS